MRVGMINFRYHRTKKRNVPHKVLCKFGVGNFLLVPVDAIDEHEAYLEILKRVRAELDRFELALINRKVREREGASFEYED